ncbi:hypothetical protein FB480_107140 [Agrobacterium vitis]|nr:hypothetical protein FB480_107140 [Agrobacterium vitis]
MAIFLILQLSEATATKALLCCLQEHFSGFATLARQGKRPLQTRLDRIA